MIVQRKERSLELPFGETATPVNVQTATPVNVQTATPVTGASMFEMSTGVAVWANGNSSDSLQNGNSSESVESPQTATPVDVCEVSQSLELPFDPNHWSCRLTQIIQITGVAV